jgi:hypothetical protein
MRRDELWAAEPAVQEIVRLLLTPLQPAVLAEDA